MPIHMLLLNLNDNYMTCFLKSFLSYSNKPILKMARNEQTFNVTLPSVLLISPSMADNKDDLPEPTLPTTAVKHPGGTDTLMLEESPVMSRN